MQLEKQSILEKTRRIITEPEKRMLAITPETAWFYHKIIDGIRAKNILELGMSVGYSTLYFTDAALRHHKNPRIITIEQNPIKIKMALANFKAAQVSKFIRIRHGLILDILKSMPEKEIFDFVLIDADKENVKKYFDLVLPMVKIGGIIATDNILLPEKYQKFMQRYTKHIKSKKNIVTGTIPLGYGQEITIRVS